jgi:hypothetical protein
MPVILQIVLAVLTTLQGAPAAQKSVKTAQVHHYTSKCWKQCSRNLKFSPGEAKW